MKRVWKGKKICELHQHVSNFINEKKHEISKENENNVMK
jgi:hypothetical protein